MKKNYLFALALAAPVVMQAQTSVFSANFDSGMPSNAVIVDEDGAKPNFLLEDYFKGVDGSPWIVTSTVMREGKNAVSSPVAMAASYLENDAPANDYLFFKSITLPAGKNITLSWDALSQDPQFLDSYDVYVYEGDDVTVGHVSTLTPFVTINNEDGATTDAAGLFNNWHQRMADLSAMAGKTVTIAFHQRTPSGLALLIDNINIVASELEPLGAPLAEAIKCSYDNATGKTTIRWSAVSGADGYQVNIYTRGQLPNSERTYKAQDLATTNKGIQATFEAGKQYYIQVRATRGEEKSPYCTEVPIIMEINDSVFPAPESMLAMNIDLDKVYYLQASPVALASSYRFNCYAVKKYNQAGNYTIFEEGFDGSTTGTMENPVPVGMTMAQVDDVTRYPGFSGNVLGLVEGGVAIINRFKDFNWSYLDLPTMTLGKEGNGKFTFTVDVKSKSGDEVVANLYRNVAHNKVELLETVSELMTADQETVTLDFTKGEANAFVSLEVHTAAETAVVDNIRVQRELAAGDTVQLLHHRFNVQNPMLNVPMAQVDTVGVDHLNFTAQGVAIHRGVVYTAESPMSSTPTAAVTDLLTDVNRPTILYTAEGVTMHFDQEVALQVYTLTGQVLLNSRGRDFSFDLPQGSVAVAVAEGKAYKLMH